MLPVTLRTRILCTAGLGLLVVWGVALVLSRSMALGAVYPWVSVSLFAAIVTLVIGFSSRHPFQSFGPGNHVTLLRAALLALMGGFILEPAGVGIAAAAVVGGISSILLDGLDGQLARRSGLASDYGARFDMETDAATVLVLSLLVWQHDKAGYWVLAGGLMRYAFVAAGWAWPWVRQPFVPTLRGRLVAIAHLVGLTVALAPFVPMPFSAAAAALTLSALAWSFGLDLLRLWRGQTGYYTDVSS